MPKTATMLFRPGSETIIWDIHLDTIIVDEHEVPEYLASGWYSHPFEARDSVGAAVKLEVFAIDIEPSEEHVSVAPPELQAAAMEAIKPRRGRPPKAKETS